MSLRNSEIIQIPKTIIYDKGTIKKKRLTPTTKVVSINCGVFVPSAPAAPNILRKNNDVKIIFAIDKFLIYFSITTSKKLVVLSYHTSFDFTSSFTM
jgi:hypothetical protein